MAAFRLHGRWPHKILLQQANRPLGMKFHYFIGTQGCIITYIHLFVPIRYLLKRLNNFMASSTFGNARSESTPI